MAELVKREQDGAVPAQDELDGRFIAAGNVLLDERRPMLGRDARHGSFELEPIADDRHAAAA